MRYVNGLNVVATLMLLLFASQGKTDAANCPCDIYAEGGTPCAAAHSTTRALYSSYNGFLYQVKRTSDNQTRDIGVLTPGGVANAAVQDSFLRGQPGTISKIYDQSPNANHLIRTPAGGWLKVPGKEANAADAKIVVNGYPAYGIKIIGNGFTDNPGMGYRNNATKGVAKGNEAEGMYMVCGGRYYNQWCCFDYGNAQTNNQAKGPATMESLYFGNSTQWGHGSGSGPWIMSDPEFGLQAGVDPNGTVMGVWAGNTPIIADYVMGTLKSTTENFWALRGGNAQTGNLKTLYSGRQYPGYYPKQLEGAIVLGIGGDNSNTGNGIFFEGAMTVGCPSDAIEDSVQANIIAAGYGRTTTEIIKERGDAANVSQVRARYNPAIGNAVVSYVLQNPGRVRMTIVDQRGRQIAGVASGVIPAGRHEAVWNAARVPAGVYVWKLFINNRSGGVGKIVVEK